VVASGGSLLCDQCAPFAILKPKKKTKTDRGHGHLDFGSEGTENTNGAATTDVDSAEHKQLPKRRSSITQTTLMWIWQLLLKYLSNRFFGIIILSFAFVLWSLWS
jgi:hypothetical protein